MVVDKLGTLKHGEWLTGKFLGFPFSLRHSTVGVIWRSRNDSRHRPKRLWKQSKTKQHDKNFYVLAQTPEKQMEGFLMLTAHNRVRMVITKKTDDRACWCACGEKEHSCGNENGCNYCENQCGGASKK